MQYVGVELKLVLLESLVLGFNLNRSLRVNARGSIEIVLILFSFLFYAVMKVGLYEDYGIIATPDGHVVISLRECEGNLIDQ